MPELLRLIRTADDAAWSRWIGPLPHDFHHTAAYHRFSEANGEGEAFLAVYGGSDEYLVWPYLLRPVGADAGARDVTSVYGYAGPLASKACGEAFLARAVRVLHGLWRSQGAITAFTRFHPLLGNHRLVPGPGLHPGGETVSLDLAAPPRYSSGLRKELRRGRRRGLVTRADSEWSRLDDFLRLYYDTLRRNGAAPWYYFSRAYLLGLREALGPHVLLMLTWLGDEIAAAGVVTEYRGIVQDHLCATDSRYLPLSPSKVLLDDVRVWAAARGNCVFHLGGGRSSAPDSLFAFKARFSPLRHGFFTGRWILDASRYRALAGDCPATGYFPAYRAPAAATSA